MSSAMPNKFGKYLNILSVFLWNISPVGAAPNGYLFYLYLPHWHGNVVMYDVLCLAEGCNNQNLHLEEKHFTLFDLEKISLSVGPLCTGHISA